MARPLRVEYPGGFYHVINRGNAGGDIFKSLRWPSRLCHLYDFLFYPGAFFFFHHGQIIFRLDVLDS